jgi:hypothetical protein
MIVYISGAISGRPNKNKQAFRRAYAMTGEFKGRPHLRNMKIINPRRIAARLEKSFAAREKDPAWEDYMRACNKKLCDASRVYFLDDWAQSEGATVERHIAKRLNMPCADSGEELKKNHRSVT